MSRIIPTLLLIVLLTGCEATKPAATPVASPKVAPLAPVRASVAPATQPAAVVVVEDPGTTPQSLATDSAAYARAMEKQLDQRQHPKPVEPKPAAAKPRVEPSDVQWLDTREFRLTLDAPIQPISASHAGPFTASLPPASFNDITVSHDVKPAPATRPVIVPQPAPAPSDELEATLARTIKTNPRDLSAHFDYQLLQFLRGEPVPQLTAISTLAAEDREVVAAVMDALSNFRTNVKSTENVMLSRKVRPLVELSDRLRGAAGLRIPTATLCTKVDGFGIYEPAEPRFPAGRESRVILYCEIENFASQLNAKNQWETRLTLETTLYDGRGTRVAVEERRPVTDLSRNRRRDFFARGIIRIPALPAGQYSLTVTVTDTQANRIAETSVPVEVLGE